ncbi:DNA polymerase III subunit delta' [uncultured Clostridium sp.]|uniref:DNA polymerase III subunit delta' n=1 Tax=uncultured Clostridium sp. TaxID=59620 RepID=UPI002600714E|nr:DNA polymerase III subunit delta' [uncultured Clostridium sp.]
MRDFIGHEALINNFKQRCLKNTLSHAHLIAGEDGVGKGKLANILAKFILNGDLDREYVDIINYSSEKSSFGVDDVRDIIEEVYKKPFEKDKKVIIIHEGNKLTIQAQNALLKTIEEPPKGVYIIILCESLELILDTIKSRCEIYKLKPLTKSELYEYIKIKKFNYDENEIKSAIAFSEGVPGRIDRYFNDDKLRELRNNIVILIKNLNKNDLEAILQQEESFSNLKNDKEEVLNIFGLFIRDILINKEIENEEFIINSDKLEDIKELTKEMSFKKLNNMIKTIEEARRNIKSNVSWGMMLRVMLIGFMEG